MTPTATKTRNVKAASTPSEVASVDELLTDLEEAKADLAALEKAGPPNELRIDELRVQLGRLQMDKPGQFTVDGSAKKGSDAEVLSTELRERGNRDYPTLTATASRRLQAVADRIKQHRGKFPELWSEHEDERAHRNAAWITALTGELVDRIREWIDLNNEAKTLCRLSATPDTRAPTFEEVQPALKALDGLLISGGPSVPLASRFHDQQSYPAGRGPLEEIRQARKATAVEIAAQIREAIQSIEDSTEGAR
jgi:adenosyl cobinamide kinase/adenosyl cobinamide phosphate guanylyltransferase